MAKVIPVTPVYAIADLPRILEIEQRHMEERVADLSEEQMAWPRNPKAKSALDILCHLAYGTRSEKPTSKAEALEALRANYARIQRDIATPGKLDEPVTWWTGEVIPRPGAVWGAIRHRCYHLGELVYLRQVLGMDEPRYYHEE